MACHAVLLGYLKYFHVNLRDKYRNSLWTNYSKSIHTRIRVYLQLNVQLSLMEFHKGNS